MGNALCLHLESSLRNLIQQLLNNASLKARWSASRRAVEVSSVSEGYMAVWIEHLESSLHLKDWRANSAAIRESAGWAYGLTLATAVMSSELLCFRGTPPTLGFFFLWLVSVVSATAASTIALHLFYGFLRGQRSVNVLSFVAAICVCLFFPANLVLTLRMLDHVFDYRSTQCLLFAQSGILLLLWATAKLDVRVSLNVPNGSSGSRSSRETLPLLLLTACCLFASSSVPRLALITVVVTHTITLWGVWTVRGNNQMAQDEWSG